MKIEFSRDSPCDTELRIGSDFKTALLKGKGGEQSLAES